nr:Serine/threonine-protein kinase ulk3 [Polyrhizophydium stewartii]
MSLHQRIVPLPSPPSYTIIRRLGAGTSGCVYLAQRQRTRHSRPHARPVSGTADANPPVALKVIATQLLRKSPERQDRLVQEIAILKRLRHPHIVQLLDFEWDADSVFLALEWCDLGTLSDLLAKQPKRRLAEAAARRLLRQTVSGLEYLRANGIVHPENLLLSKNPYGVPFIKIADFGIAGSIIGDHDDNIARQAGATAALGQQPAFSERVGTLLWVYAAFGLRCGRTTDGIEAVRYMAPEVLAQSGYDARCDIWSLGVIFYDPHAPTNTTQILKAIISPFPRYISLPDTVAPGISVEARELVCALLTRSADERISFDALFKHNYVDLAHLPGPQSQDRGVDCIAAAVQFDRRIADLRAAASAGRSQRKPQHNTAELRQCIDAAIASYTEGVAHLIAHTEYAGTATKALKEQIHGYMDRIETLRGMQ